jgi:uncharacterized protein (TIGR00255 family)
VIQSMTAYASLSGSLPTASWSWEMRGVNARGLDLRLRLPEATGGLEAMARAALVAKLSRGNVTLNLRLMRNDAAQPLQLDPAQLDRVLHALEEVQQRAFAVGVTLAQATAADVLNQRGVIVQGVVEEAEDTQLINMLSGEVHVLLEAFCAMRRNEGAALLAVIQDQLTRIDALTAAATIAAEARRSDSRAALTAALRRVAEDVGPLDEARLLQELALLAIKTDITEEIDRLRAHAAAARALLADPAPAGRKLDFLAQEFNREANTLCSKAQSAELTRIGLELKAAIEQMREQIQNVE